ncbi:unnamed protein product, partial [Discosporangium mesarthrocarpum]
MAAYNPNDELKAIVQRKQYEVKKLLDMHSASDDPLQASQDCRMRMSYLASASSYHLRSALRKVKDREGEHEVAVVADLKRRSPTAADLGPDVSNFDDAADMASKACESGASVIMVNTDGPAYGGSM